MVFVFLYLLWRKIHFARPPRSGSPKTWLRSRAEDMITNGYREWTITPLSPRGHPPERQQHRRLRRPERLRPSRLGGPNLDTYPDGQDVLVDLGFYSGDTINQVQPVQDQRPQTNEHISDQPPVPQRQLGTAVDIFHRASQQLSQHFAGQGLESSRGHGLRRSNAMRRSWSVRSLFNRHRNQRVDEESNVQHHDFAQTSVLSTREEGTRLMSSVTGTPAAGSTNGLGTEFSTANSTQAGRSMQSSLSVENKQDLVGSSGTVTEKSSGPVSPLFRTASGSAASTSSSISSIGSVFVATASVGHMTSAMAAICVNIHSSQKSQSDVLCEQPELQDQPNDTTDKTLPPPHSTAAAVPLEELKDDFILQRPKGIYTGGLDRPRHSTQSSWMTVDSVESCAAAESCASAGTSTDTSNHEADQFQKQSTQGLSSTENGSKPLEQAQATRPPEEVQGHATRDSFLPLMPLGETRAKAHSEPRLLELAHLAEADGTCPDPAEEELLESRSSSSSSNVPDLPSGYPQVSGYLDPSRAMAGPLIVRNAECDRR